ncbi:hypothetical protein [Pseudomarimonas arenosa]|uniref:Uncharacterized protein n=1 Tax=Pseudomarimonas arenosa TaxID=2774145 RepID=A0AAW3ZGA9_9GAMM|nr:hypothetical protein [Pseudomarimonas arenosa]MBD8525088.1 hypothetical protein [Pseudomarimonas arenosa]
MRIKLHQSTDRLSERAVLGARYQVAEMSLSSLRNLLQVIPVGQDGNIGGPASIRRLPFWLVNGYKPLLIDPAQLAPP